MADQLSKAKVNILAPHLPWNVSKVDDLGPTIMKFTDDHEAYFRRWSQKWFENFQFVYGNQSVKWSRKYDFAVDVDFLRRESPLLQKAQTNLARVVLEGLASMIYGILPSWEAETAHQSSVKGKRLAKIVQKIMDAYMERLNMDEDFQRAAAMYAGFGQIGAKVWWDTNAGQILKIPKYRQVQAPRYTNYMAPNMFTGGLLEVPTPMIGSDGQPIMEDRWEAEVDEMGRQIIQRVMSGDVRVDWLTPFEYRREIGSAGFHRTKYAQHIQILDYDEFEDRYGEMPGKTRKFKQVQPGVYHDPHMYQFAVRHFLRTMHTTPPTLLDTHRKTDNVLRGHMFRHKVLVVEHYDKPHLTKWPEGRRVVVANGMATHVNQPDYHTNKIDGWHPFAEAQWLTLAPSSVATGPMHDVVAKNRELNTKDSLIATALRRNMGSMLLIKTGMGLDPQRVTGEPGAMHEVADPFAARWLHDEMPIPPVINQIRDNDKEDIFETSGAGDAIRGDRTKGVSSGYHAKQIQEREEKRLTPARRSYERMIGTVGQKLFACVKANIVSMNDDVVGYLERNCAGDFRPDEAITLLTQPVDFGVDIKVKKDSMISKSKASMQATLAELAQTGPLNDRLMKDPRTLDEFLKFYDAETLRDTTSPHRDRADRENESFLDMMRLGADTYGGVKPAVMFEDEDEIHLAYHQEFLVKYADEIMQNEWLLLEVLTHIERHRLQSQEKMGQQMPGTSLQTDNMMAATRQMPTPTVQTIAQFAQQKAMQPQQPQAPGQPAPAGSGGPPQQDPNAPSANTPAANQGGPPQ